MTQRETRTQRGSGPSVRDVLLLASQYASCRIVEAGQAGPDSEVPPSTQPMPGAPKKAPLTLRAQSDVAAPTSAWTAPAAAPIYRAVPPPRLPSRPASPTPVEPIRAFRPAADAGAADAQVKKHDSYYPMEVPIDAPRAVRESSMFPAASGPRRSAMGWAAAGLAAFAIVLALLTVADRARAKAVSSLGSHETTASLPRATSELPTARPSRPTQPLAQPRADRPVMPQDVRGVDPADLPDTKGVDVSTLPLVSTVSPSSASIAARPARTSGH